MRQFSGSQFGGKYAQSKHFLQNQLVLKNRLDLSAVKLIVRLSG